VVHPQSSSFQHNDSEAPSLAHLRLCASVNDYMESVLVTVMVCLLLSCSWPHLSCYCQVFKAFYLLFPLLVAHLDSLPLKSIVL
jgi:hypothetical protein